MYLRECHTDVSALPFHSNVFVLSNIAYANSVLHNDIMHNLESNNEMNLQIFHYNYFIVFVD